MSIREVESRYLFCLPSCRCITSQNYKLRRSIRSACACDVVSVKYKSETISHTGVKAFLAVVVILEMSVVLHCNPRLVVGKCLKTGDPALVWD